MILRSINWVTLAKCIRRSAVINIESKTIVEIVWNAALQISGQKEPPILIKSILYSTNSTVREFNVNLMSLKISGV